MNQYEAAEKAFSEFDFECISIEGDNGWETDGEDRLISKFYYKSLDEMDSDSIVATFCVNFVPGESEIKEAYVNW